MIETNQKHRNNDHKPAEAENSTEQITFYTICNSKYFLGVVGLLNSLRVVGHQQKIVVLDCGLTSRQQEILRPHCTLYSLPKEEAKNPLQYKPFPYLLPTQGTVVIIDSDMLVTRNLETILNSAKQGKICLFPDLSLDRHFPEWQEVFKLDKSPRQQIHINSGFVVFSVEHHPNLLTQWWQACEQIFALPTVYEGASLNCAYANGDQDALNAILASSYSEDSLELQSNKEEIFLPFLHRVKIADIKTLACEYGDREVTILHSNNQPKPWDVKNLPMLIKQCSYAQLLRRLFTGKDVAIKLSSSDLPLIYRPGIVGDLLMFGLGILNLPSYIFGRFGLWVKKWILRKN
ncbi:MAG: hypothetical protein KME01_04290 [Chroococcus sp. CMT-3BRIN-NPC107]|jgi:hypothetical protein|nr:hypothetical protein [Chroococcus sp. CMT-3BRIN-NPC107]